MKKNNTFTSKVLNVVRKIPEGSVMSYGEVAKRSGNPKAARAVARIMQKNTDLFVPCHRVICADGAVGGYNNLRKLPGSKRTGTALKRALLEAEGVVL